MSDRRRSWREQLRIDDWPDAEARNVALVLIGHLVDNQWLGKDLEFESPPPSLHVISALDVLDQVGEFTSRLLIRHLRGMRDEQLGPAPRRTPMQIMEWIDQLQADMHAEWVANYGERGAEFMAHDGCWAATRSGKPCRRAKVEHDQCRQHHDAWCIRCARADDDRFREVMARWEASIPHLV